MSSAVRGRLPKDDFKKAQEEARQLLEGMEGFEILEEMELEDDGYIPIPFPYGPQPGRRIGWKDACRVPPT